ncbi:MAG TPA: hypothetical protein VGJ66_04685 [Pyrinomonadaceae bacterium]|jgi:hypothetical protein
MILREKMSFDDEQSFDPRSLQLELPFDVSWTTDTATDKLHHQFEDHRIISETVTPRLGWPKLTLWVSYAAGIMFIAAWALN